MAVATEPIPPHKHAQTIVIAEDDGAIRTLVEKLLTRDGFRVTALKNGSDALEHILESKACDLLLLDLMMPVVSGFDVIEFLRRHPHIKPPAVVAMTAFERADLTRLDPKVVTLFIRKPFDVFEFVATISDIAHAVALERCEICRSH